jgi:hypothetical protein
MAVETRYPASVSVYEALRVRPGALARLESLGLTRDYLDFRIDDAARALGMPVERLTAMLEEEAALAIR